MGDTANKNRRAIIAAIISVFILLPVILSAQSSEQLLQQGKRQMEAGRYGEAIAVLNNYIVKNPQDPTGYFLRALSYDKRTQYENAVLDLRRAVKLDRNNAEYQRELNRVLKTWHDILYKKIEGHKREIAIDPSVPDNYLAIARAYANLEQWQNSEEWYDKYLAMAPDASSDEIIRYTNVLTQTKSFSKAEKKIEEYTERYPQDWRLWSRLGWFRLWLGKNKEAVDAFEKSLAIKPFFKEAEEGIDLAKKQGYVTQFKPGEEPKRQVQQEYPIDRYYRILRNNPSNDEARFRLVEELVKEERMEEAYQQLLRLKNQYADTERFTNLWNNVVSFRENLFQQRISDAMETIENDPLNKEAVYTVAKNYENLGDYDSAIEILDYYFSEVPDETDPQLLFLYARTLSWYKEFENAKEIMDRIIENNPDNLDYLLYRGQLSVWTNSGLDTAREYLERVYAARPNSIEVLLTLSQLEMLDYNFDQAQKYLTRARQLDPLNEEIIKQESNMEFKKLRAQEEKNFLILEKGRNLVQEEKYDSALSYYRLYLEKAGPNRDIYKEYGDIQFRAEHYDSALAVYDSILTDSFMPSAALQRGQVYFKLDKPEKAVEDLRRAVYNEPENFYYRLYLGDAYAKAKMYDQAEEQYDTLRTVFEPDSSQRAQLKIRRGWIPASGLSSVLERFPTNIRLGPSAAYYSDDLGFWFLNYGSVLDIGVLDFLTVGVSFYRSYLINDNDSRSFNTFKGNIYVTPFKWLTLGIGTGPVNSAYTKQTETSAFIRLNPENKDLKLEATYLESDAGLMLYSPRLLYQRQQSRLYRINAEYKHESGMMFSGYFQYLRAAYIPSDTVSSTLGDNEGNAFQVRIGKELIDDLVAGYEYYFSNFRYDTYYYYSPINFESHSIWGEATLEDNRRYNVAVGGKLGYVPRSDYILREIYVKGEWTIYSRLVLTGRIGAGSSSRDDSSYNSSSGQISLSWMIY